jgi:hypothetical protein
MEQTISGESDVQTIFETLLTTSSPPNQPPFIFFEATGPARGYSSGRGRLAPSGGWLRACRASKGPQGPITLALSRTCGSRWRVRSRVRKCPKPQFGPPRTGLLPGGGEGVEWEGLLPAQGHGRRSVRPRPLSKRGWPLRPRPVRRGSTPSRLNTREGKGSGNTPVRGGKG